MGGYGVGPMPKKSDETASPVKAPPREGDGDADPDEANASMAAESPPNRKISALGRAALNKS